MLEPVVPHHGDEEPQFAIYPRRYWLLFLLSITSMQTSCVWLTWSPAVTQVPRVRLRARGVGCDFGFVVVWKLNTRR